MQRKTKQNKTKIEKKQTNKQTKNHTGTVTVHLIKDRHHGNEENAEGSIHKAN